MNRTWSCSFVSALGAEPSEEREEGGGDTASSASDVRLLLQR